MELMDSIQSHSITSAKNPDESGQESRENDSNQKLNWTPDHLKCAVRGIAKFHAIHYGQDLHSAQFDWVGFSPNLKSSLLTQELSRELLKHAHQEFPNIILDTGFKKQSTLIETLPQWWEEIEQMPKTLIHNDFNPRNIAFRAANATASLQLCAYDWELVTRHLPQRDLAELLCFTCNPETDQDDSLIVELVELHRQELFKSVLKNRQYSQENEHLTAQRSIEISKETWHRGFQLSLYDFLIGRLAMYFIPHTLKNLDFLKQTVRNTHALIRWSENYVP
jgi:hypothetical protein